MSNIGARFFLNDINENYLKESEGYKRLISKYKMIAELEKSVKKFHLAIGINNQKIESDKERLSELNAANFFKKILNIGNIKAIKKAIAEDISLLQEKNKRCQAEILGLEQRIGSLNHEIDEFVQVLAVEGIKPSDIFTEYNEIIREFKEVERMKKQPKSTSSIDRVANFYEEMIESRQRNQ